MSRQSRLNKKQTKYRHKGQFTINYWACSKLEQDLYNRGNYESRTNLDSHISPFC
jgi:hypothetical protein